AFLSGLYSYLLLLTFLRFAYNLFARISPVWAFIPALALGLLIFRGRLRSLGRFMKDLYLDRWPHLHAWWTSPRKYTAAAATALLLFVPVWRETVRGRFLLEPDRRAVIRAITPGQVMQVLADE